MTQTPRNPSMALAAAALAATPAFAQPMVLNAPSNADRTDPAGIEEPAPAAPAPLPAAPEPQARPRPPPARAEPQAPRPVATASVRVGQQEDFTRLSFQFPGSASLSTGRDGDRVTLSFSRAVDLDIAELRSTPPRFVRDVRRINQNGQALRLAVTVDPGVRTRHFVDGDRVVVDFMPPAAPAAQPQAAGAPAAGAQASQAAALTPPQRPPISGPGSLRVAEGAESTRFTVTWPSAARAAAFRRGEAIWLAFDANGPININDAPRAGRRHSDIEVVRGDGVIALRIPAAPDVQVTAEAQGSSWEFTLGARAEPAGAAPVTRDIAADGRGRLEAAFGRDGAVRWISDPEIGDRIAVAMVDGPARGVDQRRATIEAAVLPAAHGAVIEARADGVSAAFVEGKLVVTRGQGLVGASQAANGSATPSDQSALADAASGAEDDAADGAALSTAATDKQVRETIDDLTRRAAAEGVREGALVTARMALARYLLEQELAAEALGALRLVSINQGQLAEIDPEFRLMRGAANAMMRRHSEALADLNASALADNPSAALWRGYAAEQAQDWAEARRELERGRGAMETHPPRWRARFQLALARSALALNDIAAAELAARAAIAQSPDLRVRLRARLVEAQVAAMRGQQERALSMLDELARQRDDEVAVQASLAGIVLRRASGLMRPIDTVEALEALRFRWRGDSTEIGIVAELGEVYSELGRWRDALATMRTVADRFPADPAARRLRYEMTTLFERLFLDGEADRLEPIQALGLFYEFSDLTPVGRNGDRIVRLLAGRLVHVDLLEQAAQLLQHQVDERLQGIGRAQVAGDLAAIYLMDNKPDRALTTLAGTRQANMPQALLLERRILEARALLGLGRLEHAVELVERDRSENAQRIRADAAWRARDWTKAAVELRALLALRDRSAPLDEASRLAVLRTAIALTLAQDEPGVQALYREFAGPMAGSPQADSFEVVASGVHAEGAAIRDVARAIARTDLLDRFMQDIRARMTAEAAAAAGGAPAPAAPPAPAPAGPAPASPALPANQRQTPTPAA